jgi:hypothetical protein
MLDVWQAADLLYFQTLYLEDMKRAASPKGDVGY